MTNPLTSLDEIIWKQFEKVTNYAHKNYGWDKWDLVEAASKATAVFLIGEGTYIAIPGSIGGATPAIASGTFMTLLGGALYGISRGRRKRRELEEWIIIKSGTIPAPKLSPWRPLEFGLSFYSFYQAADYLLNRGKVVPSTLPSMSANDYNMLSGLFWLSATGYFFFNASESYFSS